MIPLKDTSSARRFPFMTIVLILVNVYVFYLELTAPSIDAFVARFALNPSQVSFADPASLTNFVTAIFLHGGFLHLLSNMLFLWVFGDNIEDYFGPFLYLLFFVAGGVFANAVQFAFTPEANIPILGASGAIAGVLGAYWVLFPRHSILTLVPIFFFITFIRIPARLMLLLWFVLQVFAVLRAPLLSEQGGVAYFAHIGGFLFGLAVAYFATTGKTNRLTYANL